MNEHRPKDHGIWPPSERPHLPLWSAIDDETGKRHCCSCGRDEDRHPKYTPILFSVEHDFRQRWAWNVVISGKTIARCDSEQEANKVANALNKDRR